MFICIEIPDFIQSRIRALQQQLKGLWGDVAWVKPGNIHLTLKFLGELPAPKLVPVQNVCAQASQNLGAVTFEVSGAGCFPSRKNPRVLWVGVDSVPEKLKRLHAELEQHLQRQGFPREDKPFSPHLTLGRLRSSRHGESLVSWLMESGFAPEKVEAREIILMKSELHPGGSVYTALQRFPFG
jgi:2'-5' RNA ligase